MGHATILTAACRHTTMRSELSTADRAAILHGRGAATLETPATGARLRHRQLAATGSPVTTGTYRAARRSRRRRRRRSRRKSGHCAPRRSSPWATLEDHRHAQDGELEVYDSEGTRAPELIHRCGLITAELCGIVSAWRTTIDTPRLSRNGSSRAPSATPSPQKPSRSGARSCMYAVRHAAKHGRSLNGGRPPAPSTARLASARPRGLISLTRLLAQAEWLAADRHRRRARSAEVGLDDQPDRAIPVPLRPSATVTHEAVFVVFQCTRVSP